HEVASQFGPTQIQIDTVVTYLRSQGFNNIKIASNNLLIEADGDAKTVQKTFQTSLAEYKARSGRIGHANTKDIMIPQSISTIVSAVLGLDTTTEAHIPSQVKSVPVKNVVSSSISTTVPSQVNATTTSTSGVQYPYNVVDLASFYNAGSIPSGSKATVGIIADGPPSQINTVISDLGVFQYQNQSKVAPVNISALYTYTTTPSGVDTTNQVEWNLDTQAVAGMSGGVKNLKLYVGPDLTPGSILAAFNLALTDNNPPNIISMSFGSCDSPQNYYLDSLLRSAYLQNITVIASTGDNGSAGINGCPANPDIEYPASSPWLVAVGGTDFTDSSGTSEKGWTGSGGGKSAGQVASSWQAVALGLPAGAKRQIPDIAYSATGVVVVNNGVLLKASDGGIAIVGGTSLSAPSFAGVWARYLTAKPLLGSASPYLYQLAKLQSSPFNDMPSGVTNGAYNTAPGWDFVTGWGSLDITKGLASLNAISQTGWLPAVLYPLQ
ncbi:MAG: protease pro-enzyme activation domain-containing protein, partial [Gammaproteobacteria bacterium]